MTDFPAPTRHPAPEALLRLDLQTLIGQPLDTAREIVRRLGGHVYVVVGGVIPANIDRRRVKVEVEQGNVSKVWTGLS